MKAKIFNRLKSFFLPEWVKMKVDKMLIDPSSGRYHVILKGKVGKKEEVFLHSGFLLEESVIHTLFLKNSFMKKLFNSLKLKFKAVKILKKIDQPDSAMCEIKVGFYNKKIYLSPIEALKIAHENNIPIKVKRNIIGINYYNLGDFQNRKSKIEGNIFFLRHNERGFNQQNEVIM
ncbi:MAG: hypothetical protein ACP5QT_07600 [Brevinematia bacterium]